MIYYRSCQEEQRSARDTHSRHRQLRQDNDVSDVTESDITLCLGGVCEARGCDVRKEDQVSGLIESVIIID